MWALLFKYELEGKSLFWRRFVFRESVRLELKKGVAFVLIFYY